MVKRGFSHLLMWLRVRLSYAGSGLFLTRGIYESTYFTDASRKEVSV